MGTVARPYPPKAEDDPREKMVAEFVGGPMDGDRLTLHVVRGSDELDLVVSFAEPANDEPASG